jgi:hypothetical protein
MIFHGDLNDTPIKMLVNEAGVTYEVTRNRVRHVANKQKATVLATLRDTLLPRLISGQLRVGICSKS